MSYLFHENSDLSSWFALRIRLYFGIALPVLQEDNFLDSYLLKIPDDGGLGNLELFPDITLSNWLSRNRKFVA